MSHENPLWGAPRIHGELLMFGIEVAQSSTGKEPSTIFTGLEDVSAQSRRRHRFDRSFRGRTISFKLLYGLVILHYTRRRLVAIGVTSNPTAEWIADR
jgi:hypothetical protein